MKDKKIIWDKDASEVVLIPAGTFEMGSHFDVPQGHDDERPVHEVELDSFYIDGYQMEVQAVCRRSRIWLGQLG